MRVKIKVGRDFAYDGIKVIVMHNDFRDRSYEYRFAMPAIREEQMVDVNEGEMFPHFADLTRESAEELMNDLWECGIRPTIVEAHSFELNATKRHLSMCEDIIRHFLKMNKVGINDVSE